MPKVAATEPPPVGGGGGGDGGKIDLVLSDPIRVKQEMELAALVGGDPRYVMVRDPGEILYPNGRVGDTARWFEERIAHAAERMEESIARGLYRS